MVRSGPFYLKKLHWPPTPPCARSRGARARSRARRARTEHAPAVAALRLQAHGPAPGSLPAGTHCACSTVRPPEHRHHRPALRILDPTPQPRACPSRRALTAHARSPRRVGEARASRWRGTTPTESLRTKRPRARCPPPLAPVHSPAPERPSERTRARHNVRPTQAPRTASGR